MTASRQVHIRFFAVLREQAGVSTLDVTTSARTPADLYAELTATRGLTLPATLLRVAINDRYAAMDTPLSPGDRVVFIPPVAGG
jgi:molybdopterin synthase sulfur carrier subunit